MKAPVAGRRCLTTGVFDLPERYHVETDPPFSGSEFANANVSIYASCLASDNPAAALPLNR